MGQFKPGSRPGAYNQAIAPVDNVTPLRAKQQTERADEVQYNKLIADAHRNYNKSWESGIKVEGAGRQNALDLDRLVRGTAQKFEAQAIQDSYNTAIRNAENEQIETTQNARQLADFVSKAIDTGFTIHKARDEAINKSQTNAIQSTMLRHGTSIEDLNEIRGIELDLINDENTTDARVLKYRELGYSNDQLRSIIGAREGVYALAEANSVRQAINLLPVTMFNSDMQLSGFPEGTTPSTLRAAGDTAGLGQAYNQHVLSILRQTGKDFNIATVQEAVEKGRASVLSQGAQVHSKNEAARFESEQINQVRNNVLAGTLPQRWKLSPGLITGDFERLKKLARDPSSGVTKEFVTNLREQVNPATGIKYGDQYGYEIDQIYDAIHSEDVHQQQVGALKRKQTAETYHKSLDTIAAEGGTVTPEGAEKIIEDAMRNGLYGEELNVIKARLNALAPDTEPIEAAANLEWANTVKNDPHLIGWTEEKIWEIAPNRKWAQKKISEMHTRQGRDADLKSAEGAIETALKIRLGEQIKDRYGSETFYGAYDYAVEKYKADRAALGKNGHLEALKIFKDDLGDNKHAGRYAVPDVSKDTETVGFNNFQLSAVDINTEPKTHKSLSNDLDKAAVEPSLVSSRLAAIGDIDTSHLTTKGLQRFAGNHGNINAPDDPEMWRKMQNIRDAIGGKTTTMDVANAILAARGVEVKTYKAPTRTADRVLLEVQERYNKDVAVQVANGTATVRGKPGVNTGIIVTSAQDASGEPGSDFVISNGQRGARFNFPYRSKVVRIERNSNWETHLEKGPGRRGPGNFVELEVQLPNGTVSDVRIAHLDDVANIQVGQELPAGSFVGTQGRTGSTTDAHMSLDWYKPGTTTPDWGAADWFLNNYLRQPQQQPQQTEPATNAPEKVTNEKVIDKNTKVGISSITGEKVVMYWNPDEMNWEIQPWNEIAANVKEKMPSLYKQLEEYNP